MPTAGSVPATADPIMEHDGESIETISVSANSHGIRTLNARADRLSRDEAAGPESSLLTGPDCWSRTAHRV
jgi:hypothetical protein